MDAVRSIKVLERGPDHRLLAWGVELEGCMMRWVDREKLDIEHWRIEYCQVEGDLARFEGYWQLERDSDTGAQTTLVALFDMGMPKLSDMVEPIVECPTRDNSR